MLYTQTFNKILLATTGTRGRGEEAQWSLG